MNAKCIDCQLAWNVSILQKIPKSGYICPKCEAKRKKRQTILDKAITLGLELFYSFAVSYFVGTWAIDYAYKERGYFAIGGEYMLIGMTFAICFWAIKNFLERR